MAERVTFAATRRTSGSQALYYRARVVRSSEPRPPIGVPALADVPEGATASYAVNPFGSESYGAALVTVTLRDGSADRMVCAHRSRFASR